MTTAPGIHPLERLKTYASFVRFEHTLFSLPLLLAGVFSAPGPALSVARWLVVGVAAIAARSAAMSLNRLIDRRLDQLNPRTSGRELPAGRMRMSEAWGLLLASVAVYLGACAWLGPWFLRVAAIPLVVFAAYPYLKRFTPFCHFGVGAALALAPLAGYAAAHLPGRVDFGSALWLAGFALCWVSGFDIIYATLDEAFDLEHRVHSMVTHLGRARALRLSAGLHMMAFLCLVGAVRAVLSEGPSAPWAWPASGAALAVAGVLLYLEQRWADDVDLAFFKVNVYVGFASLMAVLLARGARGF